MKWPARPVVRKFVFLAWGRASQASRPKPTQGPWTRAQKRLDILKAPLLRFDKLFHRAQLKSEGRSVGMVSQP